MQNVVGIDFQKSGKMEYYAPKQFDLKVGDWVVVESKRGIEMGRVKYEPLDVADEDVMLPLKQIVRLATEEDKMKYEQNELDAEEAMNLCKDTITYTTQTEIAVALNEETDLTALRKSIVKWCQLLLTNRSMALIAIVDLLKQAKNRRLQLLTLAAVNGFFEDVMHAKVGIIDDVIYQDLQEDIKGYTKKLAYNQIILMYDQITEAHKKLNQNVNPTLVFEQIVIKGVK